MTQLEQTKRAYATLLGRVDSIITKLEKSAAEHIVKAVEKSFCNE